MERSSLVGERLRDKAPPIAHSAAASHRKEGFTLTLRKRPGPLGRTTVGPSGGESYNFMIVPI